MLVPIEWLAQFVELPAGMSGAELAAKLVSVGLEEESVITSGISGDLVVGRLLSVAPEPQKNGKIINWCQVDVGADELAGIICGAQNISAQDLVVVALPGTTLPGGMTISARKTYGHVSAGMICAADELGLPEDGSGGVIILRDRLPEQADSLQTGDDALELLGLRAETLEVNITPDRGYALSLRGIAREYAHATRATFHDPVEKYRVQAEQHKTKCAPGWEVQLSDNAPLRGTPGCSRYVALQVSGIDPQAKTPFWMANRLLQAGMRPLSLAVDVTNYVMLALGQPLHAFDVEKLKGPIVVRRARSGEKLTTLDEVERKLFPEDLLITDSERVLAFAGVFGGAAVEVDESTTNLLLEAATFDPVSIARTARRHKLSTEASRRFERGVDPDLPLAAAWRAASLLVSLAGGTIQTVMTDVGSLVLPEPFALQWEQIANLVGVDYSQERVVELLEMVGCTVTAEGNALQVQPPSWRPDLRNMPDLAEEVARLDGYDNIPSILPRAIPGHGYTEEQRRRELISTVLAASGWYEVLSLPFVGEQMADDLLYAADDARRKTVRLANPLSAEAPLLRTSVLETLVGAARRNAARGQKDIALYELGHVLAGEVGQAPTFPVGVKPAKADLAQIQAAIPPQPRHLGLLAAGDFSASGWWGAGRLADLGDVLAVLERVARSVDVDIRVEPAQVAPFHPGRCAQVFVAGPEGELSWGFAGELHPKVVASLDLPERTVAAELNIDVLLQAAEHSPQAHPISAYPMAVSDVALTVDTAVTNGQVAAALVAGAGEHLESVELFDQYQGEQAGEGKKSLAYRLRFRAADKTLTTKEVNVARDAAVAAVVTAVGAVQRGV